MSVLPRGIGFVFVSALLEWVTGGPLSLCCTSTKGAARAHALRVLGLGLVGEEHVGGRRTRMHAPVKLGRLERSRPYSLSTSVLELLLMCGLCSVIVAVTACVQVSRHG